MGPAATMTTSRGSSVLRVAYIWLTGSGTILLAQTIDEFLEGIVLIGAAVAAVGVIVAGLVKFARFARHAREFFTRASIGVDELLDLPGWRRGIEERLGRIEQQVGADFTVRHEIVNPPHRER
jgi:hypothetical protein